MLIELVVILFGLLLATAPSWIASVRKRKDHKRLDELRSGADEAFFEERRELSAYPQRGYWQTRWLGIALILAAVSSLVGHLID